jgi:hypothetical protein
MLSIMHYASLILLFAVQLNFCMQPETVLLDDGYEWTNTKNRQHIEPFAGKVVAYRSGRRWWVQMKGLMSSTPWPPAGMYMFYTYGNACIFLHNHSSSYIRRITLSEARDWNHALKNGEIKMPTNDDAPERDGLSLDTLMPSEQRKYFCNQVHKTFWETHRLLWLGKRDQNCILNALPRDIVRLLARQVFEAEVDEVVKKAKPEDVLVLE